ncbi:hypothetical protein EVAR_79744_1 [Eumeta japonica]|uniref:Uncharacterized protein n=1 Tax=Eumeta variegata TaxID=151549 RepID=A0A4C1TAA8_EUMVA|nr:hypothetical protein EVAR_79744_1 [Eumeta japonica]
MLRDLYTTDLPYGLKQLASSPTREPHVASHTPSLLDLLLISQSGKLRFLLTLYSDRQTTVWFDVRYLSHGHCGQFWQVDRQPFARSMKPAIDGISSDPKPVIAGVSQDFVLFPTLFLLHINNLLKVKTDGPDSDHADDPDPDHALDQDQEHGQNQDLDSVQF